ncbi:MAG TPA: response regulator [Elusimicrobiota bacterium]|nr:response regulator [Elusimicrobiota bacterium]
METPDILIVDDDSDLRRTLVLLLGKTYRVAEAAGGPEALRVLEDSRPRLILLDVAMPEMSGIDVLRALSERREKPRVVMLTSHTEIELAKTALDLGAVEYLTKPFDADYIRAEVARLLAPPPEMNGGRPWRVAP